MAVYDLTKEIPNKLTTGDILNCPYSGRSISLTLPGGRYQLECWGAQGGYRSSSTYGGKGGYSSGELLREKGKETTCYLQVGASGNSGGYNGGGTRTTYKGGGGATDIRLLQDSLYARVIVAGGGGSDGASNKAGGYGGGTAGQSRTDNYGSGGGGGTQTGGGSGGSNNSGTFGQGGEGLYRSSGYGGAGGGGWYGGGGAYPDSSGDDDRGGGGGSGFVWTGLNKPSGYLLTDDDQLTNASTIDGATSFLSPTGTSETGHTGDGYARIIVLEVFELVPDPPTNLRQTGMSYSSIAMAWDPSKEATGYKLYKDGELLASLTKTNYTDGNMHPDESHFYSVLAYNANGDGDRSTSVAMQTEFAYYDIKPVIKNILMEPNQTTINAKVMLSVKVEDELVIYEPIYFYAGELHAGEI